MPASVDAREQTEQATASQLPQNGDIKQTVIDDSPGCNQKMRTCVTTVRDRYKHIVASYSSAINLDLKWVAFQFEHLPQCRQCIGWIPEELQFFCSQTGLHPETHYHDIEEVIGLLPGFNVRNIHLACTPQVEDIDGFWPFARLQAQFACKRISRANRQQAERYTIRCRMLIDAIENLEHRATTGGNNTVEVFQVRGCH